MSDWIPAIVAVAAALSAIVVSAITGRSAQAAQRLQEETKREASAAQEETNAGTLALNIARRTDARLNAHEAWREELVNEWLPAHEARDRAVERELAKLDPNYVPPPWQPLPRMNRFPTGPASASEPA